MWLLESEALRKFEAVKASGVLPTADQEKKFIALHGAMNQGESRILTVAGNQAEISIKGIMTNTPDIMAMLFGGGNVTYPEIVSALAMANNNSAVDAITLNIDSPGGEFVGLFDVLAALQMTSKPVNANVGGFAASGAYAIAAQADTINAGNVSTILGSIGVAASIYTSDYIIDIASTNAPNKRPNAKTLEGQAAIREELDAMHEIFVDSIATGRGTTIENVNATFGRGGVLLAGEAMNRGMIDTIAGIAPASNSSNLDTTNKQTASNSVNKPRVKTMNLEELKTQHADVYAAAVKVGHDDGLAVERDRVTAHLLMAEASGDFKTATTAIKDGSGMTQTIQAAYLTAGMNRKDINARQDDNVDVNTNVDDINKADSEAEQVATLVESKMSNMEAA